MIVKRLEEEGVKTLTFSAFGELTEGLIRLTILHLDSQSQAIFFKSLDIENNLNSDSLLLPAFLAFIVLGAEERECFFLADFEPL